MSGAPKFLNTMLPAGILVVAVRKTESSGPLGGNGSTEAAQTALSPAHRPAREAGGDEKVTSLNKLQTGKTGCQITLTPRFIDCFSIKWYNIIAFLS